MAGFVGRHLGTGYISRITLRLRSAWAANRLKTIFDALCVPRGANQLGPFKTPDADEDPFFCLLEDDSLITKASVETDTLLAINSASNPNDAKLVITVRLRPSRVNADNIGFG